MSSELRAQLNDAVKTAMKAGDKPRVAALRLITAALKQKEVDERIELDDQQILAILDKLSKQRRESIEQFQKANRDDLVAQETYELQLIAEFLPAALSDQEIDAIIAAAITSSEAKEVRDMGKVMAIVKPQLQGRADMSAVSNRIKAQLS